MKLGSQPDSPTQPSCGQWLLMVVMAAWLAIVPMVATLVLAALTNGPPQVLVQMGLVAPGRTTLPHWAFGLLATVSTSGLHLSVFISLFIATRQPGREFLHTVAALLIAIALFQALNALTRLPQLHLVSDLFPSPTLPQAFLGTGRQDTVARTLTAALRLVLLLPFLLLGLAWVEMRRQESSLLSAWRRVGLRLWLNPAAMWLALGVGAVIVWPWVLVGSLGSIGTTVANVLHALPNALGEEILFRGFAFAWLWRVVRSRTTAAMMTLLLFFAAQGGAVLPSGDWGMLLCFGAALLLGLLVTELTIRAGGSIWPAVAVHFLYDWFRFAFVDPRSDQELFHWLVRVWMLLAAGGMGLFLWLGRKILRSIRARAAPPRSRGPVIASVGFAGVTWLGVIVLYLTLGVPGFQPDGFLIVLEEQADLAPAEDIADPLERRVWVYHTLVETAERSQSPYWVELEQRGINYRPHYLINMIEVQERPGLRHVFAGQPGVASVLYQPSMRRYPHSFQLPNMDPSGPRGVEWNVREVGADRVWGLGYTGVGVVVGSADTGVAWTHPALKEAYLGWNGEFVEHNFTWYDPWDGSREPWDDNGHGTHTIGTIVGQDGENQVGLAPGARWMACRNMRHGIGNPGSYLSCMEFMLSPFPLGGDPFYDGDPAQGADVVNNSWGCPREEGCFPDTLRIAVDNLRAAGQMMVVSAGNEGPGCSTVQDPPAIYDSAFSVGAISRDGQIAGFSSRGPVVVDASQRSKPDIVAPGVDVRSAVPGGYMSLPGTSMAGPHVTGAVTLLWSVDPALIGDIDQTEALIAQTAKPMTVDAVCAVGMDNPGVVCACGDDMPDSVPNNVYGWGQVDVLAAAQMLLGGER